VVIPDASHSRIGHFRLNATSCGPPPEKIAANGVVPDSQLSLNELAA
jgi:hypothetical protein